MFKIFKSDSGSAMIAAAVVVSVVAVASSWALMGMVSNSALQVQFDHDAIQEELFLRSESVRAHLAIESNNGSIPPPRGGNDLRIKDSIGKRDTQYNIVNKVEQKNVTIFMGQSTDQVLAIKSLISAKHENEDGSYDSPVQRLTEKLVRNQSLAQYQYFTDTEKSENSDLQDDIVKFWGPDVLNGPVHSNDDIWLQNAGGGWPTFHSMVTTAKRFRVWPTGALAVQQAPMDQIFLAGYAEEVPPIVFNPDASELRNNAAHIAIGVDIVYAKLNGGSIQTKFGNIVNDGQEDFEVYSWYPHNDNIATQVINNGGNWFEDSDNVWTNEVTMYDTIWSTGPTLPISANGNSYYFPDSELWVEGMMQGKVTLGSAKRVYITDDIW